MTVADKGNGGLEAVSGKLSDTDPLFGGVKLSTGRFVHFLFVPENCPAMKRGRTLMYKNGKDKSLWKTIRTQRHGKQQRIRGKE